jgi:protein gp37
MADQTSIEWADATWNPVTGCVEVSPGCDHCYAKTFAERWRGTPGHHFEHGFDLTLRPERLDQPLRWKKPRRIFVNSMSDLFHKDVPDEFIADVWHTMAEAPQHTFQILTKRHARMRSWVKKWCSHPAWTTPLPNVWLGVSVESQQWADIRIPALCHTPAAVRFLSCEPLLGPVDLHLTAEAPHVESRDPLVVGSKVWRRPIDWVIAGGESGHGARPMHPDWARSLRDQCADAHVPFLFKQWGEWATSEDSGIHNVAMSKTRWQYQSTRFAPDGTEYRANEPDLYSYPGMESMLRVGKGKAGRLLDGCTHDEFPTTEGAPL